MNDIELKRQAMYKGHFEQSMSKNLFGGEVFKSKIVSFGGTYNEQTNQLSIYANIINKKILFSNFKPNTRYTFFIKGFNSDSSFLNYSNLRILYSDNSTDSLGFDGDNVFVKTTKEGKSVISLYGEWQSGRSFFDFDSFGIMEGVKTIDDFVPYGVVDNGYEILQPNGESLRDYKIYGNSVQEGTPTVEAPIEVMSLGEKSKNLLKLDGREPVANWEGSNTSQRIFTGNQVLLGIAVNNYFFNDNIVSYEITKDKVSLLNATKNGYGIGFDVKVSSNTIYSMQYKRFLSQGTVVSIFYDVDGNYISNDQGLHSSQSDSWTINTPNGCEWMVVCFIGNYYHDSSTEVKTQTFYDIQLEQGSTATPYVPYGNIISVNVAGKNLFDINNPKIAICDVNYYPKIIDGVYYNGAVYSYATGVLYYIENYGENTYTFSHKLMTLGNASEYYISIFAGDSLTGDPSNPILNRINFSSPYKSTQIEPITFTTNKKYICFAVGAKAPTLSAGLRWQVGITDIQLEKGSTATPYTSYYNQTTFIDLGEHEPLRKIGDYADYIDFKKKKIVRKVHRDTLTGNENYQDYTDKNGFYVTKYIDTVPLNYRNQLCNYCPTGESVDTPNFLTISGNLGYYILRLYGWKTAFATKEEFKAFLQGRYEQGNPMYVEFKLKTPIEEDFPECPDIPTPEIDCTVTVSSGDEENFYSPIVTSDGYNLVTDEGNGSYRLVTQNKNYKVNASGLSLQAYVK